MAGRGRGRRGRRGWGTAALAARHRTATLADVTENATDTARAHVRSLIVTGDNRLKQGGPEQARKARETYEKALAEAEAAGLADDLIRSLLVAPHRRLPRARGRRRERSAVLSAVS